MIWDVLTVASRSLPSHFPVCPDTGQTRGMNARGIVFVLQGILGSPYL